MPFKDAEARRAYDRERRRLERAGLPTRLSQRPTAPALADLRLDTAKDVVAMLRTELSTFLAVKGLPPSERLRGAVMAGTTLLRAFEQVDMVARLEALEARMGAPSPRLRSVGG